MNHQKGETSFIFSHWGMRAVEVLTARFWFVETKAINNFPVSISAPDAISTGSSPLVIPPANDSDTDRRSVGTLFHWARTLPCSQPDLSSSRCGQKPRLRARCHGENDDILYFFQWCAASSSIAHGKPEAGTLHVNMDVVQTRFLHS